MIDALSTEAASSQRPRSPATVGLPDPPAPPPPVPILPGLLPLSEAQIVAALRSGATCILSDRGETMMAAAPGIAIVNDGRRTVHLAPEAKDRDALLQRGTFHAERLRIEVHPEPVIARDERRIARDASVNVVGSRNGFGVSHGPAWVCGS